MDIHDYRQSAQLSVVKTDATPEIGGGIWLFKPFTLGLRTSRNLKALQFRENSGLFHHRVLICAASDTNREPSHRDT